MSKVQTLRVFINQRLTQAAEEIFDLFERTVSGYEEELCRKQKLLDAFLKPEIQLHGEDEADVQLLVVEKEEEPCLLQEWTSRTDQEDPPDLLRIKEEQQKVSTSQSELSQADVTFTPVLVKSDEDPNEKPQSSQLRQTERIKTEVDGGDCREPEPDRSLNPDSYLQPDAHDNLHSSECDADDRCVWEVTTETQSFIKPLQIFDRGPGRVTGTTPVGPSKWAGHPQKHNGILTGGKPFSCSVCGERYTQMESLIYHMRLHSEGDLVSCCSVCNRPLPPGTGGSTQCGFCGPGVSQNTHLGQQETSQKEDKLFSCHVCGKRLTQKRALTVHLRIHTGEKPFTCSICSTSFSHTHYLNTHMRKHTGEKPYRCSICAQRFTQKISLKRHLTIHTGEKPFRCSVCGQTFAQKITLKRHLTVHTGEKLFSCNVCGKGYNRRVHFRTHKCLGESSGTTSERL